MLQRAASNAYSWWWASHIRTKQSKWLEHNLQDMEERVTIVLKLVEEEGDSFAKRAEMYFKNRPELIHFVEESYRAYRALAERYDHISTELQNANTTIAAVFPDQVQFAMDDDDEYGSPSFRNRSLGNAKGDVPTVQENPANDLKGLVTSAMKKMKHKKSTKDTTTATIAVAKSGFTKAEGTEEIVRLCKRILALQTEKEFAKSCYESGLAKYWEMDNEMKQTQDKICSLEDEFGEGMVIEDDEARNVMAATAIKSCNETLIRLQEKQKRSVMEAEVEQKRIKDAGEKLVAFKNEFLLNELGPLKASSGEGEVHNGNKMSTDIESLVEKMNEKFEVGFGETLSVGEMEDKIDELVNKVINMETEVSSHLVLIERLRVEMDELQAQIQALEVDKCTLIDENNHLLNKLRAMEEKLHWIQDLNRVVEERSNDLRAHFTEAHCTIDNLSEKLQSMKPDEVESLMENKINDSDKMLEEANAGKEIEAADASERENSPAEVKSEKETGQQEKQNPYASDDCGILRSAKWEAVEVSGWLQKEESVMPDEVQPSKENKINDSDNMPNKANAGKEFEAAGASEREDSSAEVKSEKELEEQEKRNPYASDGWGILWSTKPETVVVSGWLQKEDSLTSAHDGGVSHETSKPTEKCRDQITGNKAHSQASSMTGDTLAEVESKEHGRGLEDEPDWKKLFLKGIENKEKILLMEYTSILRNYKNTKKKLKEVETNNQNGLFEIMSQLKELMNCNAMKDEEILSLRRELSLSRTGRGENNNTGQYAEPRASTGELIVVETSSISPSEKEVEEDIGMMLSNQSQTISEIEEKFRMNIDELLNENLDFWFRFTTAFQEVSKLETEVKGLQEEILKLDEQKMQIQEGSSTTKSPLISDVRPLYKHLREVQRELNSWVERSLLLKDELKNRFSSLCDIQEEITKALKESAANDEFRFTSYQSAKFQGEILNMKQENNKVSEELQTGLDHVKSLQLEVERTLAKLSEDWELTGSKYNRSGQLQYSNNRTRVPLRSFIFGVKSKKQKTSIFACVHPALHRKYATIRSGLSSNR